MPWWDRALVELDRGLDQNRHGQPSNPLVVIDCATPTLPQDAQRTLIDHIRRAPSIVVMTSETAPDSMLADAADLVLSTLPGAPTAITVADLAAEVTRLRGAALQNPHAALSLVWLLRRRVELAVEPALVAESATYSTLQAGPEFAAWLARRGPASVRRDDNPRVAATLIGDRLEVTLTRAAQRNAVDRAMTTQLLAALRVAQLERGLTVSLRAEGPDFSSGGDLAEFGTAPDPATAHLLRISQSVGSVLHELRDRTTAHLQGWCIGAGVELPAFCGSIRAQRDTRFRLPEVAMGLVPGAGGTVSVARRIGRSRTAWLALTGETIDARTALEWRLVDAIDG